MNSRPNTIITENLKDSHIPERFKDWSSIVKFAATFDPIKEPTNSKGLDSLALNSTISERRAALFFEYRRYNHFGYPPSPEMEARCVAVIESIRSEI